MKKLHWLSDSPTQNTGYATISRNILNRLSNKYDCTYWGHNITTNMLMPGTTFEDGTTLNFKLLGGGREPFCKDLIQPRLRKYQPDYFGILLDTFMLHPWGAQINLSPAKTFFYFPSDGGGFPHYCENILKNFHKCVAMSKYAQKQVKDEFDIDVAYIPHAVDTGLYRPLSIIEKQKIRKELVVMTSTGTLVKGGLNGKFVVGVVARNQPRKMLDRTFKAFSRFILDTITCSCGEVYKGGTFLCPKLENELKKKHKFTDAIIRALDIDFLKKYLGKDYDMINFKHRVVDTTSNKPNAILYLHTDKDDIASFFPMQLLIEKLGLENRVVFSPIKYFENFPYEQMNDVYNVMDVFFLSTSGEGFGVPTIEAMSCEVPVVVTDYTTTQELVIENGVCGIAVPLIGTMLGSWSVERALIDIDKAANALSDYYFVESLRNDHGKSGREKVLEFYDWKVVMPMWEAFLEGL